MAAGLHQSLMGTTVSTHVHVLQCLHMPLCTACMYLAGQRGVPFNHHLLVVATAPTRRCVQQVRDSFRPRANIEALQCQLIRSPAQHNGQNTTTWADMHVRAAPESEERSTHLLMGIAQYDHIKLQNRSQNVP